MSQQDSIIMQLAVYSLPSGQLTATAQFDAAFTALAAAGQSTLLTAVQHYLAGLLDESPNIAIFDGVKKNKRSQRHLLDATVVVVPARKTTHKPLGVDLFLHLADGVKTDQLDHCMQVLCAKIRALIHKP